VGGTNERQQQRVNPPFFSFHPVTVTAAATAQSFCDGLGTRTRTHAGVRAMRPNNSVTCNRVHVDEVNRLEFRCAYLWQHLADGRLYYSGVPLYVCRSWRPKAIILGTISHIDVKRSVNL